MQHFCVLEDEYTLAVRPMVYPFDLMLLHIARQCGFWLSLLAPIPSNAYTDA